MKTLFIITSFFFTATILFAQEKTFVREYTYKASEMDSKISCRAIAINQLRSMLLNEIGVYVESESLLKTTEVSGKFAQDFVENIATVSAGITKLEVIEEKWNGETFWMKASITVDKKDLEKSLKQLVEDRQKLRELEDIKQKLNDASKEINRLKAELDKNQRIDRSEQKERYYLEINTLLASDYFYNGNAKHELQDYRAAIADYSKAIEIIPGHVNAYFNRGLSKIHLQDYRGAIADYTKAIEINPEFADAYFGRGVSRAAIVDYSKAIEINPEEADFYVNRGLLTFARESCRQGNLLNF